MHSRRLPTQRRRQLIRRRPGGRQMALLDRLRVESLAVEQPADPWLAPLQRVRGKARRV